MASSTSSSARTVKFAVRIQRFLPFIGFNQLLILISLLDIVLICLPLAGATSSAALIPDLHLATLSYTSRSFDASGITIVRPQTFDVVAEQAPGISALQIQVGYFGICYTLDPPNYVCSRNIRWLASQLKAEQDPLNLLYQAQRFKNDAFWPYFFFIHIVFVSIAAVFLSTFPTWREERTNDGSMIDVKPFPQLWVAQVVFAAFSAASLLLIVSAVWNHVVASTLSVALEGFSPEKIRVQLGTANFALTWVAVGITVFLSICAITIVLSIAFLDRLTSDGSDSDGSPAPSLRRGRKSSEPAAKPDTTKGKGFFGLPPPMAGPPPMPPANGLLEMDLGGYPMQPVERKKKKHREEKEGRNWDGDE